MASISWAGGTLANVWHAQSPTNPAARFNGFEPRAAVVGPRRVLLANGAPPVYRFRDEFTAAFELRDLPNSALPTCLALALHLSGGGTVTVTTGDADGRVYPNCALAPDAEPPQPTLSEPTSLRYTMAFELVNLDGTPLVARY